MRKEASDARKDNLEEKNSDHKLFFTIYRKDLVYHKTKLLNYLNEK